MNDNSEAVRQAIKKVVKKVGKVVAKIMFIPLVIFSIIIILLGACVYFITVDDGTYKEGDWKSTGYGAAVYKSEAKVNSDGSISAGKTAKEIWDELRKNGSSVTDYLSGPKALAKLMNAELVTSFPDTRSNPDEKIDWDKVDLLGDKLQGIIKFKRGDKDGKTSTMSYVDETTFSGWMECYNLTGSEEAKKNVLSHFTIVSGDTSSSSNGSLKVNLSKDQVTDASQKILDAIPKVPSPGQGYCLGWVNKVYQAAGVGSLNQTGAYQAFQATHVSTDKNNIPVGAAVYCTGTKSAGIYGHVGIYVGDNKVMDNIGYIRTIELDKWIKEAETAGNTQCGGTPGWLGWGWWTGGSPTVTGTKSTSTSSDDTKNNSNTDKNTTKKVEDGKIETKVKSYSVKVATWNSTTTKVESNDPAVKGYTTTQYSMTDTTINYQDLVSKYTMPFNLLYAFLVVGESEDFVSELADLVYNSDIEITVYDNYTKNTDVDKWTYTRMVEDDVNATASVGNTSKSTNFTNKTSTQYTTTKTVITETNTLDVKVSKANVWIVDYESNVEYQSNKPNSTSSDNGQDDQKKPSKKTTVGPVSDYKSKEIDELKKQTLDQANSGSNAYTIADVTASSVYDRYKWVTDINDNVTNTTESSSYTSKPGTVKEKTDRKSKDPNFVTIYNKNKYERNASNIETAASWLFEIIQINQDTTDMLDLIKYLLYKATGVSYGVTEFDFSIYDPSNFQKVTTGSEGGLSLNTTMFTKDVFKKALESYYNKTHNQAFYNNFVLKADEIYDASVRNNVNPELVVVTAGTEQGWKQGGGAYNYWGIGVYNGSNVGQSFSSMSDGIAAFANIIKKYSPGGSMANLIMQRYEERKNSGCDPTGYGMPGTLSGWQSVYSSLGYHVTGSAGAGGYYYMDPGVAGVTKIYKTHSEFLQKCYNVGGAHAYGTITTAWEQGQYTAYQLEQKLNLWNAIFGDFGTLSSTSTDGTGKGAQVVAEARKQIGKPYVWGAAGPNSFDCSGLTMWCYNKIGIKISHNDRCQKAEAKKVVPVSQARVGDILWKDGHVGIYIGNNQYIHAPTPGQTVTIANGANSMFVNALQFF